MSGTEPVESSQLPDESSPTRQVVRILELCLTLGYLAYVYYEQCNPVVKPKAWLSYHSARAAEKVTAAAWDQTLKLRKYYRKETDQ